jgi:hypothetical protein
MADLKIQKVVSALPSVLEADTIYIVRVGTGFDLYVTNHTGTVSSYALNQSSGGGVQLGGSDAQAMVVSVDGGGPVQPLDVVAYGGTPASAGV